MSEFRSLDFSPLAIDPHFGLIRVGRVIDRDHIEDVHSPGVFARFDTMKDFRSWCSEKFGIPNDADIVNIKPDGGRITFPPSYSFFGKGLYIVMFGEDTFALAVG